MPLRPGGRRDVLVPDCWVEWPIGTSGWTAAARMAPRGQTADVAELRVYPAETLGGRPKGEWSAAALGVRATCPGGGVTARLLRKVPLGIFARATSAFTAKFYEKHPDLLGRVGLQPPKSSPRRRRPMSDVVVAGVAAEYADAVAGGSRRPVEDAASRFPGTSVKRIRYLVHEARKRRLLTEGHVGGQLTARGRAILGDLYREPAPRRAGKMTKPTTRRKKGGHDGKPVSTS
jgi:hypothetical protein